MNEKLSPVLKTLKEDIHIIGSYMKEFSNHVIEQEISEYPVYVAFLDGTKLGKPFFTREGHKLHWNYNVTILEEFVSKKVVERDKVDEFMNSFGDPLERACILVLMEEEGGFVFVDY